MATKKEMGKATKNTVVEHVHITKRVIDTCKNWIQLNFTDKVNRLDTGRVGQFVGLLSLLILTAVGITWFISRDYTGLENLMVLSGGAGIPMLFYRMKGFLGTDGNSYDRKDKVDSSYYSNKNWGVRNFTDEYGRFNTGRIGQVLGIVSMLILLIVSMYRIIFLGEVIKSEYIAYLGGESAFPMLLYRLKEFAKAKDIIPDQIK